METARGTLVTDTLRIVDKLGEGGMGSVWVADDLAGHTQVAVKLISKELIEADPSLVVRFEREASAAAKLTSPHVVRIFEHGVAAGTPFISMELLKGETLEDRLLRDEPLTLAGVVDIIGQVAEVLDEAHALGIVHRDIKPANLFLVAAGDEPFIKVLDFGIAKQTQLHATLLTATDVMVGTPAYMSPEHIAASKHVSHHADVWALGVVAYQAITGELPFVGRTLGTTIMAIQERRFRLPSLVDPKLPAQVDELFVRAFAKDIEARFDSAGAFAGALRDVVGDASKSVGRGARSPGASPDAQTFSPASATLREAPSGGGWQRSAMVVGVLAAMAASLVAFQYVERSAPTPLQAAFPDVVAVASQVASATPSASSVAPAMSASTSVTDRN